ncbi:hypothetical protein PN499_21620 [Kamptonema animale CS-326]|jgi:hypothetical protein|uniref:hypothetical protein n=1 Tax=Kamptonema animale TaxID=92934 RepID=UPI00232C977B|nr:hypothetical protein [Kamptonema animale]MDB9513801.1 hypothetical protein [Kamptonema animale CS-326]
MFSNLSPCEDTLNNQKTIQDIETFKQTLENSLSSPNSLESEVGELLREVAALKGKNVIDTIAEMVAGANKYLEATRLTVEFDNNDFPVDINKYATKLEKYSQGIEECWDFFSHESQAFFIEIAKNFTVLAKSRFEGKGEWPLRIKLFLPSIYRQENLFEKYKASYLSIPKSVARARRLRKDKPTPNLQDALQAMIEREKEEKFEEGVKATRKMFDLIEELMDEDPSYDREVYPRLEELLKNNRV